MNTKYQPIDCALHDRLEAAATIGRTCVVRYVDRGRAHQIEDRLIDVFARDGEEFIRTGNGVEVRLDNIISLNDVPFRDAPAG